MRKVLYSGAWNADVWLQLFPMSLAGRSFDSDGNCVCVCVVHAHAHARPHHNTDVESRWSAGCRTTWQYRLGCGPAHYLG